MPDDEGPRVPPQLELDDPGLTWRLDGRALVVERRPTFRGALKWLAFLLIPGGLAVWAARDGEWFLAAIMALGALIGAFGLALLWPMRVTIRAGADGVSWERRGVRAGTGRWTRASITGARLRRHPKPPLRPWDRLIGAEVRVAGRWTALATGHREPRAAALVEAFAAALGVPHEAVDLERDDD